MARGGLPLRGRRAVRGGRLSAWRLVGLVAVVAAALVSFSVLMWRARDLAAAIAPTQAALHDAAGGTAEWAGASRPTPPGRRAPRRAGPRASVTDDALVEEATEPTRAPRAQGGWTTHAETAAAAEDAAARAEAAEEAAAEDAAVAAAERAVLSDDASATVAPTLTVSPSSPSNPSSPATAGGKLQGRVFFVTVLGCDDPVTLLDAFLRHYFGLGIQPEATYVVLHTAEASAAHLAEAREVLARYPAVRTHAWVGTFHAKRKVDHVRRAMQVMEMGAGDWLVYADSDEFHEYIRVLQDGRAAGAAWQPPLLSLLALLDQHSIRAIRGEFVDRFAPDGALPAVDPGRSPFDQYPLCCHFTRNVIKAACNKIVAWRPDMVMISEGGFHGLHNTDPASVGQLLLPAGALVHHFKWTDGLADEMRRRHASYSAQQFRSGTRESAELLAHLDKHGGRVDVSDEGDADCWPCSDPEVGLAGRNIRDRQLPLLPARDLVRLARKHKSSGAAAASTPTPAA
jgi:hypothetical protein